MFLIKIKNKPLTAEELIYIVAQKLSNGKSDDKLIQSTITEMLEEFELMQYPDGKIAPYQFP